jgi:protein-disulfide isomerase
MAIGTPKAPVTVIEYGSLGCPTCARWNNDYFPAFKAKHIDTGKVRYVLREFLTGDTLVAAAGFLLARCAGKHQYFKVVDQVWRQEAPLLETDRNTEKRAVLVQIAASAGLSEAQFNACMSDDAALKALNARSLRHHTEDKINATPTFVINGQIYSGPLEGLDDAVSAAEQAAEQAHHARRHARAGKS